MKKLMKLTAIVMVMALVLTGLGKTSADAAGKAKINKKSLNLTVGKSATLKVKNLTKKQKKKLKWSSSKKKVATVSKKGKVVAKKAGKTTITAKTGKKKFTCKVVVAAKNNAAQVTPKPATKTLSDRENLQKLIASLRANGALVEENLNDPNRYKWNDAGRLVSLELTDDEGSDFKVKGNIDTSCFTELEYLSVEGNVGITGLNISGNTKLKSLYCNNTGISSLDVSKNTELKSLMCFGTNIKTLDVSALGKKGEVKIYAGKNMTITGANANIRISRF